MKILPLLFFYIFAFTKVFAVSENFHYQTFPVTNNKGEAILLFDKSNNFSRYRIRLSSPQVVEVLNTKNNLWMSQLGSWTDMLDISEEVTFKFAASSNIFYSIVLKIQDKQTGELYTSDAIIIWNGHWYQSYLDVLNKNLLKL